MLLPQEQCWEVLVFTQAWSYTDCSLNRYMFCKYAQLQVHAHAHACILYMQLFFLSKPHWCIMSFLGLSELLWLKENVLYYWMHRDISKHFVVVSFFSWDLGNFFIFFIFLQFYLFCSALGWGEDEVCYCVGLNSATEMIRTCWQTMLRKPHTTAHMEGTAVLSWRLVLL